MLHYCQMAAPEFIFPSQEVYIDQQSNRLRSWALREGEIYTAISRLEPDYSLHHAVAFPVRLESIELPRQSLELYPMASVAMRMVLLDEDLQPASVPSFKGSVQNSVWELQSPLQVEKGTKPVDKGYFLLNLPLDPTVHQILNARRLDPRSFDT